MVVQWVEVWSEWLLLMLQVEVDLAQLKVRKRKSETRVFFS